MTTSIEIYNLIHTLQQDVKDSIWSAVIQAAISEGKEIELISDLQYQYIHNPEMMERIIGRDGIDLLNNQKYYDAIDSGIIES